MIQVMSPEATEGAWDGRFVLFPFNLTHIQNSTKFCRGKHPSKLLFSPEVELHYCSLKILPPVFLPGASSEEGASSNGIISMLVKEGGPLAANQKSMSARQAVPAVATNPAAILEPDLSLGLLLTSPSERITLLAM